METLMSELNIIPIPIFDDNYIWLIHDKKKGTVIGIDPGLADPVINYLTENQLTLEAILITHHHADHIGGLEQLQKTYPDCRIITPVEKRIRTYTEQINEKNMLSFRTHDLIFSVIETPGHTSSHVCYFSNSASPPILFSGDTLFSGGCGRLFEGSPQQMLNSLKKLTSLPKETLVYCTHEYTRSNLNFYQSFSKKNHALNEKIKRLTNQKSPLSLPSTLETEQLINPFLRAHTPEIKALFKTELQSLTELSIFTHIRQLKDNY